jgi:hypothetical protein
LFWVADLVTIALVVFYTSDCLFQMVLLIRARAEAELLQSSLLSPVSPTLGQNAPDNERKHHESGKYERQI